MTGLWTLLGRRASFALDAETAHGLAVRALKHGFVRVAGQPADPRLAVTVAGLDFPNPLGVAAGFDKNGEVADALIGLGFGFSEVGTVTPVAQAGNPKPRIFRLPSDRGVINRLGFNNDGHEAVFARLSNRETGGIVGVNVGANKDSDDRSGDYVSGLRQFYGVASYFTINISSPNTPGLRDLQARTALSELLGRIREARLELTAQTGMRPPVFLKIAPDITEGDLDDIVSEVEAHEVDGIIVSNTTLSRRGLSAQTGEAGGLSGKPVFERSTILLAKTRERAGPDLALIGVGGIEDAPSAIAKIEAGADLVQVYTGMIYEGPGIARAITSGMAEALEKIGANAIGTLRDRTVSDWASKPLPPTA